MSRLFEQIVPIDAEDINSFVAEKWGIVVDSKLKSSQNTTFKARGIKDSAEYAIRVTSDPVGLHRQRILDELFFVHYVSKKALVCCPLEHICAPIPSIDGLLLEQQNELLISVYFWAKGTSLLDTYATFRWMLDRNIVFAWGR
jgi:hypothetical protein